MDDTLDGIIKHLIRIADANNDEFLFSVEISCTRQGLVRYNFIVKESADDHVFLSDYGDTPAFSARYAYKHLKSACESWGYKYVE